MKRFTRTTWREVLSKDWAEVERSRFIDHETGVESDAVLIRWGSRASSAVEVPTADIPRLIAALQAIAEAK